MVVDRESECAWPEELPNVSVAVVWLAAARQDRSVFDAHLTSG
jgi:hypothetical protein